MIRNWNRHVHQAIASSRLAVQDANLKGAGYDPERIAVAMGTSIGSPDEAYRGHMEAMESAGYKKINKLASSAFSDTRPRCVSIDIGVRGPRLPLRAAARRGWTC